MNIDNTLFDELVDVIYQRIEEKIIKQLNISNIEFFYEGIVRNPVNENGITISADVELSFNVLKSLPNCSGSVLEDGNKVKIFYNKSNMVNAYIGVKL